MLALKLHKTKRPNLGANTFWIPIIDWRTAKVHLKNWYSTLEDTKQGGNKINYLTMVTIPKEHLVFLKTDWSLPMGVPPRAEFFVPLADIEKNIIDSIKPLMEEPKLRVAEFLNRLCLLFGGVAHPGESIATHPELILGEPLPKSCVKWTKDIRLLFRGDTRKKKQSG